jgi:hypothetical protein
MKFDDVAETLEAFGIDRKTAAAALNAARSKEDAAEAFESLKLRARDRWVAMLAGDASPDAIAKARPLWARLDAIRLTSYAPKSATRAKPSASESRAAADLFTSLFGGAGMFGGRR